MLFRRMLAGIAMIVSLGAAAMGMGAGAAGAEPADVGILACANVPPNTAGLTPRFTLWDGANRTGACVTFWGFGQCTPTYSDIEGSFRLGAWGWDNKAGSLTTYNRCDVRLFDHPECPHSGAHTTWIDVSADLRLGGVDWSNKASCVEVS